MIESQETIKWVTNICQPNMNDLFQIIESWALNTCILVLVPFLIFRKLLNFPKPQFLLREQSKKLVFIYLAGLTMQMRGNNNN